MSTKKSERRSESGAGSFISIVPKTNAQKQYLDSIKHNNIIIATGPAGTGKTYISTSYAAEQLYYKKITKIILTRPNVEAGDSLGFLPGDLSEKYAPYLYPFIDVFIEKLGPAFTEYAIKKQVIEPIPMGFLRGRSFKDAIVILDEAQNATKEQMELLLTRFGDNCKMIIEGDTNQIDIKKSDSGLRDASSRLQDIPGISIVQFTTKDIVRSDMCKRIVEAYAKP